MIKCVDAPWCRSVIPGRLIGEGRESKRIGVHEGRRQSPRVCHWLGGAVVVFDFVEVAKLPKEGVGGQYIVVIVLDRLICRHHFCEMVFEVCDGNCMG